jgi:hypothetical protein
VPSGDTSGSTGADNGDAVSSIISGSNVIMKEHTRVKMYMVGVVVLIEKLMG